MAYFSITPGESVRLGSHTEQIIAAIICHNDELSSSLRLFTTQFFDKVLRYMKVKRMGIKGILRSIG